MPELTPEVIERLKHHMDREDEREDAAADRVKRWHIGKEFPLAMIAMLIIQTGGVIWWAATTSADMRAQKEASVNVQTVQSSIDRRQDDEVQRSEGRLLAAVDKINSKLDRLIEAKTK